MINPQALLTPYNASLLEAMAIIKSSGKGITFIVDDNNKVIGVLTDGDIRTALLSSFDLHINVTDVMNRNFVFVYDTDSFEKMLAKTNTQIRIIPIVDREGTYVSFFHYFHDVYLPVASPELQGNELKYLTDAFLSTWISSKGEYLDKFEKKFAQFVGTKYAVAVANGTAALHLALLAHGIEFGDEVIVPDLTFAATANAVLHAGATPVLVDVEAESWGMDPRAVEAAITSRTRAIIPVHLYGQPARMDALLEIAQKHSLIVIEDAAEAHGAEFAGKKVGSIGSIGCFSFYGNKVITTGEGGMCTTNSLRLANKIRKLRDHGMSTSKRYWHDLVGYNYRMTNLQAAIGLAQLERIRTILSSHARLEQRYKKGLADVPMVTFQADNLPDRKKITWLVSILVPASQRARLLESLQKQGVECRPFFYSLSQMPLYKQYAMSTPVSKKISSQGMNLPTGAGITDKQIMKIRQVFDELS